MHILFPVDFSERCQASKPLVASWAQRFGAKLTVLHTIQIPISAYGGADGYPIIIDVPSIQAHAQERLDEFDMGIPAVERIVTVGDPAFEIVQNAEKNSIDLIMMPTHGYGPFRSLLLGSVAAKVLHDAHCQVWTNAHPGRPEIRNILCGIEHSEDEALIRAAREMADAWKAKLRLVHAVEKNEENIDLQQNDETYVEEGTVPHVIRNAALKFDSDLVVIGRGKMHETFGRLRSNDYAIIRDAPCPVLSI